MCEFRVGTNQTLNLNRPDFHRLEHQIALDSTGDHPTLLPVGQAVLAASWHAQMSAGLFLNTSDNNRLTLTETEMLGHVRFTPLLDDRLKDQLGLPPNFPNIWEYGTAVMVDDPRVRGNGFFGDISQALLTQHLERLTQHSVLIIGTTKDKRIKKTLERAKSLGVNFAVCHHHELPMIAPFTCTCSNCMGQGYQQSAHCPSRISNDYIPLTANFSRLPSDNGATDCFMFVSDWSFAQKMNAHLSSHFGQGSNPVDSLVKLLRHPQIDYYGEKK